MQYGTNVYRAGGLNLPLRMQNILSMSPQPDFVEIITWVSLASLQRTTQSNDSR